MKAAGITLLLIGLLLPQGVAAERVDIYEARRIALGELGGEYGLINRVDRFGQMGLGVYRFEVLDVDKSAIVVWIDEGSGIVLSRELYRLSRDTVLPPGSIRQKQAKKIAQEFIRAVMTETGESVDPKIYDVKYNLVDGKVAYQVGVRVRKDKYTVFVDPQTGQVL